MTIEDPTAHSKHKYKFRATLPHDKEILFRSLAEKQNIPVCKLVKKAIIEFIDRSAIDELNQYAKVGSE